MIETVLFDMGNVLLNFSHERMCRQIAELCRCTPGDIRRLFFDQALQHALESGRLSEEALHERLERETGQRVALDELRHAASDIFEPNPGMDSIVEELKSAKRRLVLLSNTCISHFRYARRRFPVFECFDAFVLSYEVGAMKPRPEIFEAALAAAQTSADRCFYTDDIAEYVDAGRAFGFQAERFTSAGELTRQLIARGIALSPPAEF